MDNPSTWPLVEILNGLPKHLRLKQFGSGIPLVGRRQQWNFSPQDPTGEAEDHQAELSAVTVLELSIIPDISGGMRSLRWRKCGLLTLALNRTTQQHCFRKTEGRVSHPTFHDAWRGSGSSVSLVCLVCVGGRTRETWQTRTRDKLRWSRWPLICQGRFCRDGRSSVASLVISGLERAARFRLDSA